MSYVKLWAWRVFTHGVVSVITAAVVLLYCIIPRGETGCVEHSQPVSRNDTGDIIELKQELCGGISWTDTISVIIKLKKTNESGVIFSYERGHADPQFKWYGNDLLEIRIDDIAEVHRKVDHFGIIKIKYDIGGNQNP